MTKVILLIATIITLIITWSSVKVCHFNKKLDEKASIINQMNKEEMKIENAEAKVTYVNKLDCKISFIKKNYNLDRLIKEIKKLIPKNIN